MGTSISHLPFRVTSPLPTQILHYFRGKSSQIVIQFLHCLILPIWYLRFLNKPYLILLHHPASPSRFSSFRSFKSYHVSRLGHQSTTRKESKLSKKNNSAAQPASQACEFPLFLFLGEYYASYLSSSLKSDHVENIQPRQRKFTWDDFMWCFFQITSLHIAKRNVFPNHFPSLC